ncbi:MAG: BACON domain-containing protein [Bacteroides sp.]|nr:BACON domain-containing protein [Bacteroides sp.]
MKTNNCIYYAIGVVITLLQLSLTACTDSFGEWKPIEKKNGTLTLALELPQSKTVELATRAMQEEQERDIQEISLLLFTTFPGNTEQLHSTVTLSGTALLRNSSNNRLYTTTATLEPGTYSTIIALANSAGTLLAQSSLMVKGTARSQIEKELLLSLPDNARWEAAQPNPRRFPMWGQIEGRTTGIVISSNTPANHHIKLFRMLASIDIIIEQEDDQGQPLPAFDLTQVYLCHFYRNGRMIPLSNPTHYDGNKLLDISLPDTTDRLLYTDPLEYSGNLADPTSAPDIIIRREIYTFEQLRSDGEEESKRPFLIIEGEYEDTGYPSFYRIDFVERLHEDPANPLPAENNFLPLIRNHTYNIVVKEILGPGYRSFDDAAHCKPFNTVSNIFRFDDSDSEAVQFDGKYFLSVSHDSISYDKEPGTESLLIKTDSPLGWKIGDIAHSGGDGSTGWLHMDKTNGARDVPGHVNVTADAYNPAATNPTAREATFTVTCGRMEHTIQVTQSYLTGISLEIVNSAEEPLTEIWFRSNPRENHLPPDETFTVRWSGPDGCHLEVIMLGDRMFPFETSGPNAIFEGRTLGTGEENHTFTIRPTAFTPEDTDPEEGRPFLQDGATVTFSVSNGQETIKKTSTSAISASPSSSGNWKDLPIWAIPMPLKSIPIPHGGSRKSIPNSTECS